MSSHATKPPPPSPPPPPNPLNPPPLWPNPLFPSIGSPPPKPQPKPPWKVKEPGEQDPELGSMIEQEIATQTGRAVYLFAKEFVIGVGALTAAARLYVRQRLKWHFDPDQPRDAH